MLRLTMNAMDNANNDQKEAINDDRINSLTEL